MPKSKRTVTYARAAMYNSKKNVHVCVATLMCIDIYVNIQQSRL